MGEMKIELLPYAKDVKKWPFKLAHKYKDSIKKEIDNMIATRIIYPINQFEWATPMVIQMKRHDQKILHICIGFWWLYWVTLIDMFGPLQL